MYLKTLISNTNFPVFRIILIIFSVILRETVSKNISLTFPDGFLLGTATSAYQVEGAWNVDGKGENIWDYFAHNYPEKIADRTTGDVSCDFYHKYKQDIQLVKSFGFNHFRFSISWARIFPNGYATKPNPKGVRFYHKILDELEKQGLIPVVTIYHWDHPQNLEKFGSWTNSYMAYVFADYAKFIFQEYGSRVKLFVTINEPQILCGNGYALDIYAPAKNMSDIGKYMCVQNMLKAHALAYHIYDNEFRGTQGGKVGIVFPCSYYYAKNRSDRETANMAFQFDCGWAAHPIFSKKGDYPEVMKQRVLENSKVKRLSRSDLPTLSKEWIKRIRGASDFFGLNHYTSFVAEPLPKNQRIFWPNNDGMVYTKDPSWHTAQSSWLNIVPEGFGNILRKIKDEYGNPEVYVMECGVSDGGGIDDKLRLKYLYSYLKEMLIAIKRDKCNVKAFTIWSFLDSMEWQMGYPEKFGLVNVDFSSANLTRSLKKSSPWVKAIVKTRVLQDPNEYFSHTPKLN